MGREWVRWVSEIAQGAIQTMAWFIPLLPECDNTVPPPNARDVVPQWRVA
jgi:hypothetical protein